ncbi:MAG: PilN family type IVB pilus formation outer membrane protein [Candidatus Symbiodolus clandestinus]
MRWFGYLLPCCALVVGGCSAFSSTRETADQVEEAKQQSEGLLKEMQRAERQQTRVHQKPWVSKKAIKRLVERIPSELNCDITFATGTPMPFNEFSSLMNKLCGLSVRLTPDAETKLAAGNREDRQGRTNRENDAVQQKLRGIRWQGKLEGLLDVVSSSLGLSWRYSEGEISLYYLDTRTFHIFAILSETEMRSVVLSGLDAGLSGDSEGKGGGGKGQGQSSQSTSVSLKTAVVQDICKSIESMLTPGTGRVSPSMATGTITVTDTPEVLGRIQCYVDAENRSITKQVLLNVKVITLALDDSSQFDINWNLVYQTGNQLKASINGAKSALEKDSAAHAEINILDNPNDPTNKFKGSALLLDALAKQGKVAMITSPSVTTLNLQPVPVQVATQESYLARIERSDTANVGSSVSLTPGTITSGFNMNLLPFVMPDNQLLLQYSINLSQFLGYQKFTTENKDMIQLPKIDNRIFSQKVRLRSGQTLVLSGFEKSRNSANRSGTGAPNNWLLGGGVSSEQKREIIVIMITPIVME